MEELLFNSKGYKAYLNQYILTQPKRGRGLKSSLAEIAGCQTAYVSQVLNGDAHFNLEQAERVSRFLGHTPQESHFFILLLQLERAGSEPLRKYFQAQINEILEKRLVLRERLDVKKTLSLEAQATYYSAWYFAAIHVLLSIPELQTKDSIAKHLGLSVSRVSEVLEFLVSVGLAEGERDRFRIGTTRIHLGSDSPMISKHHSNWRMKAIQSLERGDSQDLHYSSVVTLSRDDIRKIKSDLIHAIEEAKKVIRDSKEEEAYCFAIDFFNFVGRPD